MTENFFLILKTECVHRMKSTSVAKGRAMMGDYDYFYNHERIQAKTKLAPLELRRQFAAWIFCP
ncbi:IS3 family transposase [Dysosmobacter sp.]|uniref:IS3 family transposase n=1 Tax=Dysosmobacter sp. TaxID=2591382 RepID=UPI002AA0886C|nr:IS3 family transposase [Dysosmobacter sp.]